MSSSEYYKQQKADRLARGLCVNCGKDKPLEGRNVCAQCAQRRHDQTLARKTRLEKKNLCITCGRNERFGKLTRCADCIYREQTQYHRNRDEPEIKARANASTKRRHDRLKAAGLCVCCGKSPAIAGHSLCVSCNEKNNQRSRQYKSRYRRKFPPGTCCRCGKPPCKESQFFCEEHYLLQAEHCRRISKLPRKK